MPPRAEKNDYNALRDGIPRFSADQFNLGASAQGGQNDLGAYDAAQPSSGGRKPGVDSLSGLRALPELRQIPWVPGKELPPEKSIESPRTQTRGAFLLSTRGHVNNPPCTHCASGSGRFSVCISLGDWFHGACSTCQMATRGNLCSLRTGKDDTPSMNKSIDLEASQTPTMSNYNQPESSLKRKRSSPPPVMAPNNQQMATPNFSNFIQPTHNSGSGFTPSNIPTSNRLVGNNQTPATNYAYQVDKTTNWQDRATSSYQTQNSMAQEQRLPNQTQNNHNAAQYSTPMNTYNGARMPTNVQEEQARDPSTSMSPSTQLLQPPQERPALNTNSINTNVINTNSLPAQNNYRQNSTPYTPLIDQLPRHKQKKIFGIFGGIQSGIRSVKQQTEYLQKQLDLLQAELGIDVEDDNGDG